MQARRSTRVWTSGGHSGGFVKVRIKLAAGGRVELKDRRRKIEAVIVDDTRPDRTALRPIEEMI